MGEREIIQTAAKDMLTFNGTDESDKSDKTTLIRVDGEAPEAGQIICTVYADTMYNTDHWTQHVESMTSNRNFLFFENITLTLKNINT